MSKVPLSIWLSASDWLLFNAKRAIFQLYHDENRLHFHEMMSTLYLTKDTQFDFYISSSPKQQSAGWHVTYWHINIILHPPVFVLNAVCLVEKQLILILCLWFDLTLVWTHDLCFSVNCLLLFVLCFGDKTKYKLYMYTLPFGFRHVQSFLTTSQTETRNKLLTLNS